MVGLVGLVGLDKHYSRWVVATIKTFEDLECWQESRGFVKHIYTLTKKPRFSKDFELKNQITRSAVSVMANIAEGFHRNSNEDFMRFLDYSRSSLAETISHVYIALDQEYIDENDIIQIKQKADGIWKKINALISYLRKRQNNLNQ